MADVDAFSLRVSGWLLPEVRRHLFFLVWACAVPVHVRYVSHLLRLTATRAGRSAAADLLKHCADACADANAALRRAGLCPPEASLSAPHALRFGFGAMEIVPTEHAEVLVLLCPQHTPAERRAAYWTALQQARVLETRYAVPNPSPTERETQRALTPSPGAGEDVIVVESGEEERGREVVVLSDSSHHAKAERRRSAAGRKRTRASDRTEYEVVE